MNRTPKAAELLGGSGREVIHIKSGIGAMVWPNRRRLFGALGLLTYSKFFIDSGGENLYLFSKILERDAL